MARVSKFSANCNFWVNYSFNGTILKKINFEECAGCSSPSSYNQCVNQSEARFTKIVLGKNLLKMNSKENGKFLKNSLKVLRYFLQNIYFLLNK